MRSNIRKLRNERNITQSTLAQVLGKTQQTVSHMENDRDRISIESLITIANYFGVSTDCVLGISSEESKNTESEDSAPPRADPPAEQSDVFNDRILFRLILSLLLFSLDDVSAGGWDFLQQHI